MLDARSMRPKTYTLAKAIQERKEILFGNGDSKSQHSVKEKEEAWEAVRLYMITNGFPNFEKKTWRDVRNHDWQYLRRSAAAKLEHNQKSINDPIQYSEVDKIVFDIMGNEKMFDDGEYSEFGNNGMDDGGLHFSPNSSFADQKISVNTFNGHNNNNIAQFDKNNESDGSAASFSTERSSAVGPKTSKPIVDTSTVNQFNSMAASLASLNSAGGLLTALQPAITGAEDFSRQPFAGLDLLNGLSSILERNTASPQTNKRKRLHTVDDDLLDAKLQLLLVQVKREETLLQQDQARVLQEYAKARQEHARAEMLELELMEKKKQRS